MPKSEDLSRSLEIKPIWTFDTEFPTIFNKSCTYIIFKSAVKHRQLSHGFHLVLTDVNDTQWSCRLYVTSRFLMLVFYNKPHGGASIVYSRREGKVIKADSLAVYCLGV